MKRKRSSAVRLYSSVRARPYMYGANSMLPRTQERVPRSMQRSLMSARKAGITLLSPAKRISFLQVRPVRRPLVRPSPLSRKVGRAFVFRSPFYSQYRQMLSLGRMVARPSRVMFCVKRKIRKEVLFALRKAGYRGSGPGRRRTYRRTGDSSHGC